MMALSRDIRGDCDHDLLLDIKYPLRADQVLCDIEKKILKCDFNTLLPIQRRQVASLFKRLKFQPRLRLVYIKLINIIILDNKLFQNLSIYYIFNKKREQENE